MPLQRGNLSTETPPPTTATPAARGADSPSSLSSTLDVDDDIGLTLPPSDDDETLDQDAARIYTPPPHIAARFYRPSATRRRGSAASSRRNSISSAHSRCSSHHNHPLAGLGSGPQSKHVAQHMRRASFLADRQARLADRAAHAEKVRLRAALAKSSSQQRDASVSAERALAAQQARERNLAEIAATCAEEVKRAKAVAESTKGKRETELAHLRAQIEERLAEAERRREELRSRSASKRTRAQSIQARKPGVEVLPRVKEREPAGLTPEAAAGRIQWWWKTARRKQAIANFAELGLAMDRVSETSFEEVAELLTRESVMRITARVLRICGLKEGADGSVEDMAAARTFLSAFLILGHPKSVLGNKEADRLIEQDLVAKARDQLICFENLLSRLSSTNNYTTPPTLRRLLPESYAAFHNTFIAWKSRDMDAVIETMLMQFVEMDAIWQTVKVSTDAAVTDTYRESIRENQVQIMVRIKRLAGDRTKKLIADAVRKARRERAAKQPSGEDVRPRGVAGAGGGGGGAISTSSGGGPGPMAPNASTPPPPPPPPPDHAADAADAAARPAVLAGPLQGLLPDNRIIVHELAIDREYVVPTDEFREHQAMQDLPLMVQMRLAHGRSDEEAFFDVFQAFARHTKDKLQKLVVPGNSMHRLMDELLDADVARQQFRVGSFSYARFFSSVATILPQLCAPFRDDELGELVETKLREGDLVDRSQALAGFTDAMLCDHVNYLLRMVAPGLVESSAAYETARFGETVAARGREGPALAAAESAWREARAKVCAEAGSARPSGDKIYCQMLVDVFTQPLPAAPDKVPEMLHLDLKRVTRISRSVQRIVTTGAILVQCKNLLKRDVRTAWKTEAARVMAVLEAAPGQSGKPDDVLAGVMAALEAGRSMPAVTRTQLRALVNKVLAASRESFREGASGEPREAVLRLLLTRLRGNILARLSAAGGSGSATEKVRETSSAGERLARLGLVEFVDSVRSLADELGRVGRVDRASHTEWWEAVAEKVEREETTDGRSEIQSSGSR